MKKYLLILVMVMIVLSCERYTPVNVTGGSQNDTGVMWNADLQRAVDAYQGCPNGWESVIVERPYLPKKMYCNRPKLPSNFGDIQLFFENGQLNNLSKIGKEYWDQPEFFPNFKKQVAPVLATYDSSRFGLTIPEIYPSARVFMQVSPGNTIEGETLVRTGPLGIKYTVLEMFVTYPENIFWRMMSEYPVVVNPENVEEYFDVTITPDTILFEPSFPVWPVNWTYKVSVKVDVSDQTPPGRYVIGFDFRHTTDATLVEDMLFKYGTRYQSSLMVKPGRPWYLVFIEVV